MNGRRPSEVLAEATELLDRCSTVLVTRLADMTEAQNGWPASSGWDTTPSGGSHWCWVHEQDVAACHADGVACDGEVVAGVGDRTGESALRKDRAASHRREVERLIVRVGADARRLEQLLSLYGPRHSTDSERKATALANERDVSCWSCARTEVAKGVARWEPAKYHPEVAGERRQLCEWCYRWLREVGSLPPVTQLDRHHRGQQVRRPA